jgi:TPR repeat protein
MGVKYLLGLDGTPVDKKKAREHLERAAILGHQEARKLLQHAK